MNKYNRINVYNNAVKNTKVYKLTFTNTELQCIGNALAFNILYSKMYKHIAQNLNYNFGKYLSPIILNSYQVDGLKDCIQSYLQKFKTSPSVTRILTDISKHLITMIKRS